MDFHLDLVRSTLDHRSPITMSRAIGYDLLPLNCLHRKKSCNFETHLSLSEDSLECSRVKLSLARGLSLYIPHKCENLYLMERE